MSSTYLDGYDAQAPNHFAGADGGRISELEDSSLWSPGQRQLADWYETGHEGGLVSPETPIDPLTVHFGYIHKLEVDRERDDFRYLIYGRSVAKHANMGMEGRWVSEMVEPARTLFLDHYRDLVARPRLFVGRLVYSGAGVRNRGWQRAVAPLGTAERGVTHFIVYTDVHAADGQA